MRKKYKKIIILVLAVFAVFFLINKFAPGSIKNGFHKTLGPFEKIFLNSGKSASAFFSQAFQKNILMENNQNLIQENLLLKKQLLDLISIQQENEELKKAIATGEEKNFELLEAKIIAQEIGGNTILIDRGEESGLTLKMPVITSSGALAGSISKVSKNFSRINLISSPQSNFDILVKATKTSENSSSTKEIYYKNILGLAEGKGNFRVELSMVLKENLIQKGDLVITSNMGGKFPQGLLVGEIKDFQRNDAEPFQKGEISPYFKKDGVDSLFIIKNFVIQN